MRELDRFTGCILGGAVGDALGYPVEFLSAASVFAEYGERGITEYELRHGVAEISDDTQMTLFTATGLLSAAAHGDLPGDARRWIARSYRDWYRTQTERFPLTGGARGSWLANVPALFSRRAPGNTCLSALRQGGNGTVDAPLNDSKGCGGVMRVAPVGLFFAGTEESAAEADRLAADAAALTHGHEMGYIPAAMLAHIVYRAASGASVPEAVEDAMAFVPTLFPRAKHMPELTALLQSAVRLAQSDTDDLAAIEALGEGWQGDEALAIAVFCALRYSGDFERGVAAAVNHGGDSDSTGAIAGNILGASLGLGAIPEKFTERLELKDVLLETAEDLYGGRPPRGDDANVRRWESRYLAMTYRPGGKASAAGP